MNNGKFFVPSDYYPKLTNIETEVGIKIIKDNFQKKLAKELKLLRISAPLFVLSDTGINDNLSGVERPVQFDVPILGTNVEIVQSLAKWKRIALKRLGVSLGEGIYTDMNAIRRDESDIDNIHSIYVDQWDWEAVIDDTMRTKKYIRNIVEKIIAAMHETLETVKKTYPEIDFNISKDVFFITSEDLKNMYPGESSKERENKITKKYGTVFIEEIGKIFQDGTKHDTRSPDYDDWNLNGDILVWYPPLNMAIELSSMGIRVNENSLMRQLEISKHTERKDLPYHKALLEGKLPLTIGGGIGQSRLCMMFLDKIHIGEVQSSIWPKKVMKEFKSKNIRLL